MPPSPDDLLRRAEASAANPSATQTDLRRAISDAYYALFHLCMTAAADMVKGPLSLSSEEYELVYRSIDHSRLRAVCRQLNANPQSPPPLTPHGGFGQMADFANIAVTLQEQRNRADYDPSQTYTADKAKILISDARQAIEWFRSSTPEQQRAFLIMLLFKSR